MASPNIVFAESAWFPPILGVRLRSFPILMGSSPIVRFATRPYTPSYEMSDALGSGASAKQKASKGWNSMSMFKNPRDEEKLCQILKAYVEEWGPENVIVSVPQHWSDYSTSSLGRVRLEFATCDTVSIRVEYEFIRVKYDVQLQAA